MCRQCPPVGTGRRCPSNRGERRRAYRRAHYAATKTQERFDSSHTRAGARADGLSTRPVRELTREQRITERDAARERVGRGRLEVHRATEQIALTVAEGRTEDPGQALLMYEAAARGDYRLLGSEDDRRAAVVANQHLGHDVFRAVECEMANRLEEAGLDDDSVPYTFACRVAEHPASLARDRMNSVLSEHPTWEDRLARQSESFASDRDHDPDTDGELISDDEYRQMMVRMFGQDALTEESVQGRFPGSDSGWPQNARERRSLFRSLAMSQKVNAETVPGKVAGQINQERRGIYLSTLRDELGRVQTFGGEHVEIKGTNSTFLKRDHARLAESSALYPDEMVAVAKERFPDLVARKSTKRAYFSPRKSTEHQVKTTKYILPEWDIDTGRFTGARFFYDDSSPDGWATPDTPENRERLNRIAAEHNSGENTFPASSTSRRSRRPTQVVVDEVTGDQGQTMLALRAKNPVSQTVYGVSPEITIGEDEGSLVHELGHYAEYDPQVHQVCKQFLRDRTYGLGMEVYHRSRQHGTEYAVGDSFFATYVGKNYGGQHNTEVFSMGMEALFTDGPANFGVFGKPARVQTDGKIMPRPDKDDPEHRDLILGILAGFDRQGRKPLSKHDAAKIIDRSFGDRRDAL